VNAATSSTGASTVTISHQDGGRYSVPPPDCD
jgi:hypothetical protein